MHRGINSHLNERGFTLMELVVGLVISAIVLLAGTKILIDSNKLPLKISTETSAKFERDTLYKVLATDERAFINTIDLNAYDAAAPIDALKCMGYLGSTGVANQTNAGNCDAEKAAGLFPVPIRVFDRGGNVVFDSRPAGSPGMPAACGNQLCGFTRNGVLGAYDPAVVNGVTWRPNVTLDLDCVTGAAGDCVRSNLVIRIQFQMDAGEFDPNRDFAMNLSKYDTDIYRPMPPRQGCFPAQLSVVGEFCSNEFGSGTGLPTNFSCGPNRIFTCDAQGHFVAATATGTGTGGGTAGTGGGTTGPGPGTSGSATAPGSSTSSGGGPGPGTSGTTGTSATAMATTGTGPGTTSGGPGTSGPGVGAGTGTATGVGVGAGTTTATTTATGGGDCIGTGWQWSCFVAGTLIDTPSGPKPIETLVPGEEVYSMSSAGRIEKNLVTQFFRHQVHSYLKITFESGAELKVTSEHPVYVANAADYVPAGELRVGQSVVRLSDQHDLINQTITSIEKVKSEEEVYNITVSENHNYFAHGVLVHNKTMACKACEAWVADATGDASVCMTGGGTGPGAGSGAGTGTGPGVGTGGGSGFADAIPVD